MHVRVECAALSPLIASCSRVEINVPHCCLGCESWNQTERNKKLENLDRVLDDKAIQELIGEEDKADAKAKAEAETRKKKAKVQARLAQEKKAANKKAATKKKGKSDQDDDDDDTDLAAFAKKKK